MTDGSSTHATGSPHSPTRSDTRQLGPTTDDLLGQRADSRSPAELGHVLDGGEVTDDVPVAELPDLSADVYRLATEASDPRDRREALVTALDTLALDTALDAGGDVVWIDSQGYAATHTLARVAPSERALDRVQIARAFTTYQHHTLVSQVGRWFRDEATRPFDGPEIDRPAVVVAPALDSLYRAGEESGARSKRLFTRSVALLQSLARDHDVPVLTTRAATDGFSEPLPTASTAITVEPTQFGPRFESEALEFETLAYPDKNGTIQTTLAFWREVLRARHGTATAGASTATGAPTASDPATGGW
jgi:hypothetical protein